MKRTHVVLALAVFSCAGCQAMYPRGSAGCGDTCNEECCEPCHSVRTQHAPQPNDLRPYCGDQCGCGGDLESECPGGNGCCFDRYCGHNCGPGYHPGPYDCSPCDSPHWGCTGHRHPHGYVDGHRCMCGDPRCRGPVHGNGYCGGVCGPAAPGCGSSGDENYTFNPGPPTGQTAYPYYTLRGPRDFLLNNPPSIGPY